MPDRDRLRSLQVRVSRHQPPRVSLGFDGEHVDQTRQTGGGLGGCIATEKSQVERHLVIARAPGVQGCARRRDLGQPPFNGGVDVFISRVEFELRVVELPLDPAQAALDRRQLRFREQSRRGEAARVGDAAGDVVRIELEVDREGGGKALELWQQAAREAAAP